MIISVMDDLKDVLQSTTGGLDVLRDIMPRLFGEKSGDVLGNRRRPAFQGDAV